MRETTLLVCCVALFAALQTFSLEASACSPPEDIIIGMHFYGDEFLAGRETYPRNLTFVRTEPIRGEQSYQPKLVVESAGEERDMELVVSSSRPLGPAGSAFELFHFEPTIPLQEGDRVRPSECSECPWATISSEDNSPPGQPSLRFEGYTSFEPNDECYFGELGRMSLKVDLGQPTPTHELLLLVYIHPTEEEVIASSRPMRVTRARYFRLFDFYQDYLEYFSPYEPFCVAIELEDLAGNRSPRSEPLCLPALDTEPGPPQQQHGDDMGSSPTPPDQGMSGGSGEQDMGSERAPEPGCGVAPPRRSPSSPWFELALLGLVFSRSRSRADR